MTDAPAERGDPSERADERRGGAGGLGEVARVTGALGLLAVGGPNAHLAIFQDHLVERRRWMSGEALAELYALCSMLPGPTSTQTLMGACAARAGVVGGVVGLICWALPAVVAMTGLAVGVGWWVERGGDLSWLIGLQAAAVGVLLVAAWRLGRRVVRGRLTGTLLVLGAAAAIAPSAAGWDELAPALLALRFPLVIAFGVVVAALLARGEQGRTLHELPVRVPRAVGGVCAALFVLCFAALTGGAALGESEGATSLRIVESFYRNGALTFGGGQVLLPLIYDEYVLTRGWLTDAEFWTGYGVVQGLPGPLFSMSAFLGGAALDDAPAGGADAWTRTALGGALGAIGLFLPGALLLFAALPAWRWLRETPWARGGVAGANATAVGLLVGAAWIMLERTVFLPRLGPAILGAAVIAASSAALALRVPAIVVVLVGGVVGALGVWAL